MTWRWVTAPALRRAVVGLALLGVAPLVGCGEDGAGTIKIDAGKDKDSLINPDFGDGKAPAVKKGRGPEVKDFKSKNSGASGGQ